MDDVRRALDEFLAAFEAVFHHDWAYTKSELKGGDPNAAEEIARIFGEQVDHVDASGATFLNPPESLEELQHINWGNYVRLLNAYSALCTTIGRPPVQKTTK